MIGRILTTVGVLLVALFVAAAAAPFLIDWTRQKATIEAQATRLLGLPTVIDGTIGVQFLPVPVLTLENVRVGRHEGFEARIESVRLELSAGMLLRGLVHVSDARLTAPRIWIGLDRQGRMVAEAPVNDLSAVRVERLEVEAGTITIEDPREGTRFFVDQIAFAGNATTILGPWRIEGGARIDGTRAAFNLQTGRLEQQAIRLRLQVEPTERPIATDFEGEFAVREGRPVATGAVRLTGVGARDAADRARGWRIEAQTELRPERAVARDVRLIAGAEDRIVPFTGAVNLALGRSPRLDAALATRQLDLDRLVALPETAQRDVPTLIAHLATQPFAQVVPPFDGRVSVDVASLVVAGGLVQEAKIEAEMRDGRWRLLGAEARLPGQATLRAAGTMGLRGGPVQFDGNVELNVRAAQAFAGWVDGELLRQREARPAAALQPIVVAGRVAMTPERIAVHALDLRVGQASLNGEVAYDRPDGRRPALNVRLRGNDVDLEPLIAVAAAFAPRTTPRVMIDADVVLGAERLRWRGFDARDVDVAMRITEEGVVAERLATRLNGVEIRGEGRFAATAADALRLAVEGERIEPLLDAIESVWGLSPLLEQASRRARALVPLQIALTATREDARARIALTGTVGGSRIEAETEVDPALSPEQAMRRLRIALTNARVDALLAQIGVAAQPVPSDRPGRFSATIERRDGVGAALNLEADLAGVGLRALGAIEPTAEGLRAGDLSVVLNTQDAGPLLVSLGLPLTRPEERLPVELRSKLVFDPRAISLGEIDGRLSGETVTGALAIRREPLPDVSGNLTFSALSVERVLGLVTGPWPTAGAGDVWAGTAFGPRLLPAMTGNVSITARRLDLDRFELMDARFGLRVGEGGLGMEGLVGQIAGGRVRLEIVASRPGDGGVRLSTRGEIAGARLEDLVWRRDGRPVATGRLDGRFAFEGAGRTPAALLGTLSGDGTLSLADGEVRGLSAAGFSAGVRASEAGMDLDEARLGELVRREMDGGALAYRRLDMAFTTQAGVIRAPNLTLDGAPATTTGRIATDLGRWTIDADWSLEADPPRPGLRGPRIAVLFRGPIDTPERRIDVRAFVDHLNVRRFEREVERLEALQREIDERDRRLREIERAEEERREREQRERLERARAERERAERERPAEAPPAAAPPPAPAPATPAAPATPPRRPAAEAPRPSPEAVAEERRRFEAEMRERIRAADPPTAASGSLPPLPPPVMVQPTPGVRPPTPRP